MAEAPAQAGACQDGAYCQDGVEPTDLQRPTRQRPLDRAHDINPSPPVFVLYVPAAEPPRRWRPAIIVYYVNVAIGGGVAAVLAIVVAIAK